MSWFGNVIQSLGLGLDMSALNEICDPLEDVGHLSHYPQPLLHQGQQLLVLLRRGALLQQQKHNGFLKKVSKNSTEISFSSSRFYGFFSVE